MSNPIATGVYPNVDTFVIETVHPDSFQMLVCWHGNTSFAGYSIKLLELITASPASFGSLLRLVP